MLSRLVEFLFVCSSNFMEAEWLGLCYNIVLYEEKMKIYPLQTTEAIWYLTQPDPPISTRESRAHTEGGGRGSRTHIYICISLCVVILIGCIQLHRKPLRRAKFVAFAQTSYVCRDQPLYVESSHIHKHRRSGGGYWYLRKHNVICINLREMPDLIERVGIQTDLIHD